MTISRYNKRPVIRNLSLNYAFSDIFRKRGITVANQFTTANLISPTAEDMLDLTIESRVWTVGEKYFKLADEFYGNPEYWWIIAWFNQKPLETDFIPGDIVNIPMPVERVLEILNVV